jgi:acyl-CoA thioesterase-1
MDAMKPSQFFRFILVCALCLLPSVSSAQSAILVLGDSLSAGYGIPRAAAWVTLLQQELQRTHPHYKVINASISGETTSGALQRMPATLKEHQPSIVIIELGANDGLRGTPLRITEKNFDSLIRQALASGAKVLLLGMQLPPNYGIDYTSQFKKFYQKLAQRHRIALVPFLLEGVAAEQYQADNLHPTAEAQPKIVETVMQKLKPML